MKTPLRYPGGKSRAVKHILPLIPKDCGELCSPFLGGGSIELAVADRGTKVYGYDVFEPLVWFWQALLSEPTKLAVLCDGRRVWDPEYTQKYKVRNSDPPEHYYVPKRGILKEEFESSRTKLKGMTQYSVEAAALFYAINRSSFSGATFSGGFSKRSAYARFTDSSVLNVKNFKEPNLVVEHADFKTSIGNHKDAFLYLDPPYMLEKGKNKLYGDKGDTHADFDHEGLHSVLTNRNRWVMSYNDSEEIRAMYKNYEIREAAWAYGMNKTKKSSEIIIIGGY
jgi:DNA adenine methylase|tara:strand:- start:4119 stop:4961 length:843 start_codon:yes stop_codon:yes gene_type:complete